MNRFEKIVRGLNLSGVGLEIGPSHNPVVKKSDGYNVYILDHLSQSDLIRKYRGLGIAESDLANIEEVDFVWSGEPLSTLVGKSQYFDYIIASHVIEHTPDLVSFIQECEKLLKVGGVLSLVIPDKRCCFDILRPLTSTGDVLQAFVERRIRPSISAIFDHFSLAAFKNCAHTWAENDATEAKLVHDLSQARDIFEEYIYSNNYIDVHNWVFVKNSFSLIIYHLNFLRLTNFVEYLSFPTVDYEFYVHLKLGGQLEVTNVSDLLRDIN